MNIQNWDVTFNSAILILTGAGRAFCAGFDLTEMADGRGPAGTARLPEPDVLQGMSRFEGPIIGAINGPAITGGFELALACDVLIASTQAAFADTHARVGILPGWGLSQKLARAIGIYRAKELSLTGNFLSAEKAEAWGLVNRVVSEADLLPTARKLAGEMLSVVPEALVGYKRMIDRGFDLPFAEGMRIETQLGREYNRGVTPQSVAERRESIEARGRKQIGG